MKDDSVVADPATADGLVYHQNNLHRTLQGATDDAERQDVLDSFISVLSGKMGDLNELAPEHVMPVSVSSRWTGITRMP
ncbi:hypothetical protein [Actibacterium sp. 188UL27-1]|uniref:hypothetical protein n=1 Tax=Actibacterium sp. 188UL27-1 TaxID=2786961 RepID=UPI00195A8C7C|nr:hypothetical protein [Actibacterium sp. 188UL27-1]